MKIIQFTKYYLIIFFVSFAIFSCSSEIDDTINKYNVIIKKIDAFQQVNSTLPSNEEFYKIIQDLGFEVSEGCPCYNKISENEYDLWFGLSLGESMLYNSKTKKWSKQD